MSSLVGVAFCLSLGSSTMAMAKSKPTQAMDELQASVRPFLKELGFRARWRAFNRLTSDGLTQVIEFQLGRFDPPGTHYVGFRRNVYGRFTVNVGVYVPEVHKYTLPGGGERSFVHEYDCDIRQRLGNLGPEHRDIWWDLEEVNVHDQAAEVFRRLERGAFPFFAQFENRDALLNQLMQEPANPFTCRPRIVCAIICAIRGQRDEAKSLLADQPREHKNHPHLAFVRALAEKLGLGGWTAYGKVTTATRAHALTRPDAADAALAAAGASGPPQSNASRTLCVLRHCREHPVIAKGPSCCGAVLAQNAEQPELERRDLVEEIPADQGTGT